MYITQLIKSLKPRRREHWLMLSLLTYALGELLEYYLPMPVCNALTVTSAIVFLIVIIGHLRGTSLKGFTKFTYSVLILWSLWLTFRMIFIDDISQTFSENHGLSTWLLSLFRSNYLMPNLIPFILLAFPRGYKFDFKYLWRIMWLMCILYLCYTPFAIWNMAHYSWSFDEVAGTVWGDEGTYGDFVMHSSLGISYLAPTVLMIYFKKYLRPQVWRCFLVYYIIGIGITVFLGRRGGLTVSLMYLVSIWIMYMVADKRTSFIQMMLVGVVTLLLVYVLVSGTSDSLFATILERGTEDTRSAVEESFYEDMKSVNDWIFGRGWFGQYYEALQGKYRASIETGYLALILRGGFIYLIPYVLTLAMTFFNGFFRSRNLFCKSFAIIALMQIISLYPSGWPAFNFLHFVIWLGVGICNSSYMRRLNDQEINNLYFSYIK